MWQPIETAPKNEHVIIIDKHEFVYRAHRVDFGEGSWINGWVVMGSRLPVFDDADLAGWMPLPPPPKD